MSRKTLKVPKKQQHRHCASPTCDFHHVRPNGRDASLIPSQKSAIPEKYAHETLRACGYCDAVWIVGIPEPGRLIGWIKNEYGEYVFHAVTNGASN